MSRLLAQPLLHYNDANGKPLPGALCQVYLSGTSTPVTVYKDGLLTIPHENPVRALTNGYFPAMYSQAGVELKLILTDADGANPLPPIDPASPFVLTQAEVGTALNPQSTTEDEALVTPANLAFPERNVLRYAGIVADGITDNTAAILTVCNAMPGWYIIPYNVLYNRKTLLDGLDPDVILFDLSQINDLTSAGETTKNIGIVAQDTDVNDSAWFIQSGHHAGLIMNNFMTAGTDSADRCIATIIWACGMFQNRGLAKRGTRGAAGYQFMKDPGHDYWTERLTMYAPWLSIAGEYEDWKSGEVLAGAGVYRRNLGAHYVSTTGGTCADDPTHLSGTVIGSDGVGWTFLDSADQGLRLFDQYGRQLVGSAAITRTLEWHTRNTDPGGGSFSCLFAPFDGAISKDAQFELQATDGAGDFVAVPFLRATTIAPAGLRIIRGTGGTTMGYLDDTAGMVLSSCALSQAPSQTTPALTTGGTITTTNIGVAKVTPGSAVTGVILQSGIQDGQECTVINQATSANSITFAAYATSHVANGTSCVIAGTKGMRFVWDSVAAAWYPCA